MHRLSEVAVQACLQQILLIICIWRSAKSEKKRRGFELMAKRLFDLAMHRLLEVAVNKWVEVTGE